MLNASTMARMEVPKATRDVAIAISELNDAVARLRQWAEEAREARKELFGYHSGKAARLHILQAGRGVRQRVASARLVENFAHRVRSRYPLPIAYRWRTVEAATPDLEGYLQILECAEATLAYTALVGVYLSRYLGREPFGKVRELGARFAQRKGHGINFGDWRSILDETSSRKFRKLAAAAPFYEVTALLDSGETEAAIRNLIDSRNDQSHGRGPKDGAIEAAFAERKTQLETLLKGVEFLSEYPLRYIESARWDSIRNENTVRYRDLMGDHPLTPVFSGDGCFRPFRAR